MMISRVLQLGVLGGFVALGAVAAPLPSDFETFDADQKVAMHWQQIESSEYNMDALPSANPGVCESLSLLSSSYLTSVFLNESSVMEEGRKKLIHTWGSVAQIRWMPIEARNQEQDPYSGLFEEGGIGFLRLSLAKMGGSFTPGIGLKVFVDQAHDVNFVAMDSLEGQGEDRNPFRRPFSTWIADPKSMSLKILATAFNTTVRWLPGGPKDRPLGATRIPLAEAARTSPSGQLITKVVSPLFLTFEPTDEAKSVYDDLLLARPTADMRQLLGDMPSDLKLYQVFGHDNLDDSGVLLGEIHMSSQFMSSEAGDHMNFRHSRRQ